MNIFECPKKCYVTNKPVTICPRCGRNLVFKGKGTIEQVKKEVSERQGAYAKKTPKLLDTSYNRTLREKLRRQEELYNNNQN